MNLLFESDLAFTRIVGRLLFFQEQPVVEPDPVMFAEGRADGNRVQSYSVFQDGGRFRMWYLAFPSGPDAALGIRTAYAESEDGRVWRRPTLNHLPDIGFDNNYCNLGLLGPGVFLDPSAPSSHRYRAVGYHALASDPIACNGTYTAHSSDGLVWHRDPQTARWFSSDTITAIHHPGRGYSMTAMKFMRRMNGRVRRGIWTADCRGGVWGEPSCALMPDEFDDIAAVTRGGVSSDYYFMNMLPAGVGTLGFLCRFFHYLPYSMNDAMEHYASFGSSDISLVYQSGERDRWLHVPGRPPVIAHGSQPWNEGWVGGGSSPIQVGDEHWLYLNGMKHDHAWYRTPAWGKRQDLIDYLAEDLQEYAIGLARWPAWRFFGFHANPEGSLDLQLGRIERPAHLRLNYKTERKGSVRVQLFSRVGRDDLTPIKGCNAEQDVVPLTGDSIHETVRWRSGDIVHPPQEGQIVARITLDRASIYAWDWNPVV